MSDSGRWRSQFSRRSCAAKTPASCWVVAASWNGANAPVGSAPLDGANDERSSSAMTLKPRNCASRGASYRELGAFFLQFSSCVASSGSLITNHFSPITSHGRARGCKMSGNGREWGESHSENSWRQRRPFTQKRPDPNGALRRSRNGDSRSNFGVKHSATRGFFAPF
jgi:hypothetical protein